MSDAHPPARRSFASDDYASEHLCDHVLTRPEAHDWALVIAEYRDRVDPTDDTALLTVAASLFSGSPLPAALALRKRYVATILRAIDDAVRLGMWWEQCEGTDVFWVGLGLDGVLAFWDARVIRSGYLPRNSRLAPASAAQPRTVNPLPRRDLTQRLTKPPPDTPRSRYELFQATHFSVSRFYEQAYNNNEILQAGGDVFVTRPVRIGKWQQLLDARPSEDAAAAGGPDETAGPPGSP